MRRSAKEINIFSMSFLDILCSGLGAVLVLLLIFSQNAQEIKTQDENRIEQLQEENRDLKQKLGMPVSFPIAIRIEWNNINNDIDLYVKDPSGKTAYFPPKHQNTGVGQLMRDSNTSEELPFEIYFTDRMAAGQYIVWAHYYSGHGPEVVRCKISTISLAGREMSHENSINLDRIKQKKLIARVRIGTDGDIEELNN